MQTRKQKWAMRHNVHYTFWFAHACTHKHLHTHTQIFTCMYTPTFFTGILIRTRAYIFTRIFLQAHSYTHILIHTRTHMVACIHRQTFSIGTLIPTCTQFWHACMHILIRFHRHAHTHTHAHTHARTHAHDFIQHLQNSQIHSQTKLHARSSPHSHVLHTTHISMHRLSQIYTNLGQDMCVRTAMSSAHTQSLTQLLCINWKAVPFMQNFTWVMRSQG